MLVERPSIKDQKVWMLLKPSQGTQHQQSENPGGEQVEPVKPKVDPLTGMLLQPSQVTQHQRLENPAIGFSCLDAAIEGIYAGYGCHKQ